MPAPDTGTQDQDTPPTHLFVLDDAPPVIPGYEIGEKLGEGGMGLVFAARDLALDRAVAVKVMKRGMSAVAFEHESKVMGWLPHPGIPPVHTFGHLPDGRPFLAMKVIRGRTLKAILATRPDRTTDRGELLTAFEQMCQAVGSAHAHGIVHRDLKPDNVMVGAFGEVQVMDWGLAKAAGGATPEAAGEVFSADVAATVAGQVKGTPAYMAPEQARGEPVGAQADVFALGGILAAILTGHPPFAGNSMLDTIILAANAELGEAFERLDGCGADEELIELAKQCLAARAADRPENGERVAVAVAQYRSSVDARLRRAEQEAAAAEARAGEEQNTRREAEAREAEQRKRRRAQLTLACVVAVTLAGAGIATALVLEQRKADELSAARRDKEAAQREAAEAEQRKAAELKAGQVDTMIVLLDDLFRSSDPLAVVFEDAPVLDLTGGGEGRAAVLGPFLRNAAERFRASLTDPALSLVRARLLAGIGNGMKTLGLFIEAKPVLEEALALRRATLSDPDSQPDVWQSELALGRLEAEGGDVLGGAARFRRVYECQRRANAPLAVLLTTRFYEGVALTAAGSDEAGDALREVIAGRKTLLGATHKNTLFAKLGLIAWTLNQGHWPKAVTLFAELRGDVGASDDAAARALLEPIMDAQVNLAKARLAQQARLFANTLRPSVVALRADISRIEKVLPEDHIVLCIFRFELASLLLDLGDGAEADALFARVLADARRTFGLAHPKALALLDTYSDRLIATRRSGDARKLFAEVEVANKKKFNTENPWLALVALKRAEFEMLNGDPDQARSPADTAVALISGGKFLPTKSGLVQLHRTARALSWSRDPRLRAIGHGMFDALRPLVASVYGPQSNEMVVALTSEGRCFYDAGNRAAADRCYGEARAMLSECPSLDPAEAHRLWFAVGRLQMDCGQWAQAEVSFRSARVLTKRMPAQPAGDREESARLLAHTLAARGRYREAVPFYEDAAALQRELKGRESTLAHADMYVAVARLGAGDGYGQSREALVTSYSTSTDANVLCRLAWVTAVDPRANGRDAAALETRFAPALQAVRAYPWGFRGLALLRVRGGQLDRVEDALTRAAGIVRVPLPGLRWGPALRVPLARLGVWPHPQDHLIRGLAATARGDVTAARAHLATAVARIDARKSSADAPFAYADRIWHEALVSDLLLAELRAALAPEMAPPPRSR